MSMTVSGSHRPADGSGSAGAHAIEDDPDFARIEAALAETERGRNFLAAYAHRHRGADTGTLLQAIARLESVVVQAPAPPRDDLADLCSLADAVAGARTEIDDTAAGTPESFEAVVQAAERTTSAILTASESIQEAAWTLRETGADETLCDVLDHQAAAIGTACASQDGITRRGLSIARTLSLLETRIAAMIAQRSGAKSDAESGAKAGPRQEPVRPVPSPIPEEDEIVFAPMADTPHADLPHADAPPATPDDHARQNSTKKGSAQADSGQTDLAAAFADLDRLSIEEKIALFS